MSSDCIAELPNRSFLLLNKILLIGQIELNGTRNLLGLEKSMMLKK